MKIRFVALALAANLVLVGAASAAVIQPAGSPITPGPLTLSASLTSPGEVGSGFNPMLTLPGSYSYTNTFTGPTPVIAGSSTASGYHDAFAFTIAAASATTITAVIDLGDLFSIDNLYVRLYAAGVGDTIPLLGNPASFGTPGGYYVATTTEIPGGGEIAFLTGAVLSPGSYVLEVRGLVDGTGGGTYIGSLNLSPVAPVPLPAGLPLLFAGLVSLAGMRRRKA
jgi:hypothetical protein